MDFDALRVAAPRVGRQPGEVFDVQNANAKPLPSQEPYLRELASRYELGSKRCGT